MRLRTFSVFALSSALLGSPIASADITQLYMQSCGACHGADGKGLGGTFPPLAESEWVAGEPDRAIKVVLHGLTGPIEVNGKAYNLVMPPQGVSLSDEQIADLLTHIRSNFGNDAPAVLAAEVAAIRKATKDRQAQWTQKELDEQNPLPTPEPILVDMLSELYVGELKRPADMRKLEPDAVEEEKDGIMDVANVEPKDNYGITFKASLRIEKTGVYEFILDADDMAELTVAGQRIARIDRIGPMNGSRAQKGNILLREGLHPFRVEYVEAQGMVGLSLEIKGGDLPEGTFLTSTKSGTTGRQWPEIMLKPENGEAKLYRNFIAGSSARGIGVGYPGDVNMVFSADDLNVPVIWKGQFIDAGRHWTGRGQGYEPPAGEEIGLLGKGKSWAYGDLSAKWPDNFGGADVSFTGYRLAPETRNPTFAYEIGESAITDVVTPSAGSLSRLITVVSSDDAAKQQLHHRLAHSVDIKKLDDGSYDLGGGLKITVSGEQVVPSIAGGALVITFEGSGRRAATIVYSWN